MNERRRLTTGLMLAILAFAPFFAILTHAQEAKAPAVADSTIATMISRVSEKEILDTATALQGFTSRAWGQPGNALAATYLHDRLAAIPGLTVEYQGDELKNVIATLKGTDPASSNIFMVGAHYDSLSSVKTNSPGATDNAAGIGVVLEDARVMSCYKFKHTIKFVCWNREETGLQGSSNFVAQALATGMNIRLYINNDSCAFDPAGNYVLDLVFNKKSQAVRDMMAEHIALYKIGFRKLTDNVHQCGGDYSYFWKNDLTAVSTHQEVHGRHYHTPQDTVDKINTRYAAMNAQVGMSVLAKLAEVQPEPAKPQAEPGR